MIDPPTPTENHRFHLLDAMRGLAAVMVVLHHMPRTLWARGTPALYLSVDFFFCLSGFVVAFAYERRLLAGRMGVADFVGVRLLRLYPMFLFATVLGIMTVLSEHPDAIHAKRLMLLQLLMVPNYYGGTPYPSVGAIYPFDIPAWSLYFEFLANFGYVLLVRLRLAKTWLLTPLAACCAFRLISLAQQGWSIEQGWGNQWWQFPIGMYRVGLSFTLGVLALRAYQKMPALRISGTRGGVLALLLFASLAALLVSPGVFLHRELVRACVVAVLFPLLVLLAAHVRLPSAWARPCAFLGDVSYPLYLLHSFLLYWGIHASATFLPAHPRAATLAPAVMVLCMLPIASAFSLYDTSVRRALRSVWLQRKHVAAEPMPV